MTKGRRTTKEERLAVAEECIVNGFNYGKTALAHNEKPNLKWLTDVTKFKYVLNTEVRKLYLNAILDLCDRRIVSFAIS